jgi:hypothetical protein
VHIPAGMLHRVRALGSEPLVFLEVQVGEILDENDIIRISDDYGRLEPKGPESPGALIPDIPGTDRSTWLHFCAQDRSWFRVNAGEECNLVWQARVGFPPGRSDQPAGMIGQEFEGSRLSRERRRRASPGGFEWKGKEGCISNESAWHGTASSDAGCVCATVVIETVSRRMDGVDIQPVEG